MNLERFGLSPGVRKAIRPMQRVSRGVRRRAATVFGKKSEPSILGTYVRKDFLDRVFPETERNGGAAKGAKKNYSGNHVHHSRLINVGMTQNLELMSNVAAACSVDLRFPFWDRATDRVLRGYSVCPKTAQGFK